MRALVLTLLPPMSKRLGTHGGVRRFSLFMAAIRELAGSVEMLHLWPSEDEDIARLDAEQSERFGLPVSTHIVPAEPQNDSRLDNYLVGSSLPHRQHQFLRFCGPAHLAAARG